VKSFLPARTTRRAVLLAAFFLAAGRSADGATVASPVGYTRPGIVAQRTEAAGERFLDLDSTALTALRDAPARETVRLERFPFAPGVTGNLVLERFEIAAPDAKIIVAGPAGETSLPFPRVAQFRGRLEGEPDSRVYVGVPGGFLVAVLQTSAGLVYVGPAGPGRGPVQHVQRRADSPLNLDLAPREWTCSTDDLPLPPVSGEAAHGEAPHNVESSPIAPTRSGVSTLSAASPESALAAMALKSANVSIETDEELLAKFGGNPTSMTAYVMTLMGEISVIYERDVSVRLTVNLVQAWTTTDPYTATGTLGQLNEVGNWWHANRPKSSYPRTLVHYLSGKPVTGGIAWLNVLCGDDFFQSGNWGGAYGVTQINGNYPSNLWDLIASAHEMGHNFGSPHTHCFSPPIDMCYSGEPGCYSGPVVNPGPLGGTLMSYCHLLSGGLSNISLRFHERCISERMLPEINSVTCLLTIPDTTPTASSFYTLTPCRVVDTRNATGPYGGPAVAANTDRAWALGGVCGIPTAAKAAALNVTVTQPAAMGDLRLYAGGSPLPLASSINYGAGQTRSNNAIAPLGSGGALGLHCDQPSGGVHVIIEVSGYFQ
jgi:hypothetical protein